MKNIFYIITAIMVGMVGIIACKNEYPMEISFTEYSLVGTSCQWKKLNYDKNIIVINSDEALQDYIECIDGNYPYIDFEKQTLLIASGGTPNGIDNISTKLLLENNTYFLKVDVTLNDATVLDRWCIALITNKLSKKSNVELNVTIIKN